MIIILSLTWCPEQMHFGMGDEFGEVVENKPAIAPLHKLIGRNYKGVSGVSTSGTRMVS